MELFFGGLFVGAVVAYLIGRERTSAVASAAGAASDTPASAAPVQTPAQAVTPGSDAPVAGATGTSGQASEELLKLASACSDCYEESAYPSDLLGNESFQKGVALLRRADYVPADLIRYFVGANVVLSCMAAEAFSLRDDPAEDVEAPLLDNLNPMRLWPRFFVLRALSARGRAPLVGKVFARLDLSWSGAIPVQFLQTFLDQQLERGETPSLVEVLRDRPAGAGDLTEVLSQLQGEAAQKLLREYGSHASAAVDVSFLKTFGRRLGSEDAAGQDEILEHRTLRTHVDAMKRRLQSGDGRSMLVVGEPGVGKSATLQVLARELTADGWTVFEAGATDVMSDQMYIGSVEGRIQTMLKGIGNRPKVLWVVPAFHELMWAGRHRESPMSLLDHLFPHIESGTVRILAETHTVAYEQMLLQKPRVRTALPPLRIESLDEEATVEVVGEWSRRHALPDGSPGVAEDCQREVVQLTWQYMGSGAAPGRVLRFLDATRRADDASGRSITTEALLASLSVLTGIPTSVLDHRASLDLDELRRFFERRVLGQSEAVDCLVDRVALVKAGLTDPARPLGVFLFTGPTGTGKTELAKTLAQYLFGSAERMIRIDMSELQAGGSLDRLLGDEGETPRGGALVDVIRQQPFSVVLLDEFEKAHPQVYSIFLQLFDDGRLTDRRGRTADFRHAIVIMTSNLGGNPSTNASVGFGSSGAGGGVDRALQRAFSPEFVNRIDRVVTFQPLSRAIMRDILKKELSDAMQRRGLRSRSWAVEWEESAIDFLLREGFTPDLGARPLKRAVERYLLSPLAKAIVNHQYPAGDQFLFVRAKGRQLQVEFVDPDAPVEASTESGATPNRHLEEIVLQAHGTPEELALLTQRTNELQQRVQADTWLDAKQQAMDKMKAPEFWESTERFGVLGTIEYMDRIETGAATAASILERLGRASSGVSRKLVGRLAQQVYLVESACRGLADGQLADTFVEVAASSDDGMDQAVTNDFASRLANMYRQWAERRGMTLETLEEGATDDGAQRCVLSVSGFGAYQILEPEGGLHVHELPPDAKHPSDGKQMMRCRVRVTVVPQPEEPAVNPAAALAQSRVAFAGAAPEQRVVRRYRAEPSPLVRDSVRHFKTGLLQRVLDGDFDVLGSS